MRRLFIAMVILVLFSSGYASAQFLGQLTPAPTLPKKDALIGGYLGVYENALSLFGQFRYGAIRYVDVGFKMGVIDGEGKGNKGPIMGGDLKYWFMEHSSGDPLDLSIGVGMEYSKVSNSSLFSIGGNFVGSYPIDTHEGRSVTPYGRLIVGVERKNHNDFDLGVALGADLKISSTLSLVGELEIEDDIGFVAGINYNLF